MLSLVTNASSNDTDRLRLVLPHWLSVLGERAMEVVVVLDETPPTGRIAKLHGTQLEGTFAERLNDVRMLIESYTAQDARVRLQPVPQGGELTELLQKWFGPGSSGIMRCQAGTPIAAFLAAFEAARSPIVLRADCDMLFHDTGWVEQAIDRLAKGTLDLVEPPRCGGLGDDAVSTRALVMAPKRFAERLPIKPSRLDFMRRVHRALSGRPPWLALEQMLEAARQSGHIRYQRLSDELGLTLHVAIREQAGLPFMHAVCAAVERGQLPAAQLRHGHNFIEDAWIDVVDSQVKRIGDTRA